MRHGHGVQIYATGEKYAGIWSFDERHGNGRMTYADGSEYNGDFEYGIFHGQGLYIWPTNEQTDLIFRGHTYEGAWFKGKMNGRGKFTHREGHVLEPHFKNNLFFANELRSYDPFKTQEDTAALMKRINDFEESLEVKAKIEA